MFKLDGKTALVTGASGGIGEATARHLHAQGAHVVLHGTRLEKLSALADQLGERSSFVAADLSDINAVENIIPNASEVAGRSIDILVNNAGFAKDGLLMRMKNQDWQSVLDVNLTANMVLCRSAMRSMMKSKWGRIISISSIVGVIGNPGQTNYAASKAGVIGFSKSLAQEVASRGITVNIVAPGFIETPMTDSLDEKQKNNLLSQVPVGRLGSADEVASAVLFLASNEASYLTGATLHVNGGMVML
ncbi:3-oxoacyl-[acyl-carrier-protein] reductase [Alphaproteobacteria bacterium]|nr:3-oxoacyl-[acyl-carrier-protein] reductase [Alphaproteobacteria bacterium]MDC0461447.1 3-oxoacyl-[acyl-carrier-protein] reductase [Alphaproteobacteria bacterium]